MNIGNGFVDLVQSDNNLCYMMVQPLGARAIPDTFRAMYAEEIQTAVINLAQQPDLSGFNPSQIVGLASYSKSIQTADLFHRGFYFGPNDGSRELVMTRKRATDKLLGIL
jgi:hypothetical protein